MIRRGCDFRMTMSDAFSPEPDFRTIEIGELPLERGAFQFVTVKSPSLQSRADALLYLPEQAGKTESLPVVILLHGVYGSHWAWALSGRAHQTLQRLIDSGVVPPMILVMPSDGLWGDGSGYLRHSGMDFENWVVDDVPKVASKATGNPLNAPHFLAGLSMGGYGALRLGARHPERFAAFSGHSSITRFDELGLFVEEPLQAYEQGDAEACSVIAAMRENRQRLKPFRFDCGVDDELIEGNRLLRDQLAKERIAHIYEEFSGGHEWPYWEKHVEKTFRFFAENLEGWENENPEGRG